MEAAYELPEKRARQSRASQAPLGYPEQWVSICTPDALSKCRLQGPDLEDRAKRRDWLRRELKKAFPGTEWKSLGKQNFGHWQKIFRTEIQNEADIENTEQNPFRVFQFRTCLSAKQRGNMITYKDGQVRAVKYSCSERFCPACSDRAAERVGTRVYDFVRAMARTHKARRIWRFVFTLPREIESGPRKGTPERKALMKEIHDMLKRAFGVKTRDLLLAYCNPHAVGDSDLMRPRVHFHCMVLPLAITQEKDKTRKLINCDIADQFDLDELRAEWRAAIERATGLDSEKVNLRVSPLGLDRASSWPKLRHHLIYDTRGFGTTFLKAPIYYAPDHKLLVLPCGNMDYQIVQLADYVRAWCDVRVDRDYRHWGLLKQRSRYPDVIGLRVVDVPEPEIESEVEILISTRVYRAMGPSGPEWKKEEFVVLPNGQRLSGVKWGRRGGLQWFRAYDPGPGGEKPDAAYRKLPAPGPGP